MPQNLVTKMRCVGYISAGIAFLRVRISSTFSVLRPFSYLRPFLYFDHFHIFGLFCTSTSTSSALLRLAYFKLCSSTHLLRLLYFDLLSNLGFLLVENTGRSTVLVEVQFWSKYSFGRSKKVEVRESKAGVKFGQKSRSKV